MKRWKWVLATTALLVAISGGAMAEEQHWRDRRDNDDAYSQQYERRRDNNGYYRGNYGYRDRDGDRDDQGYWRQRRDRDHDRSYYRHHRDDRGRDHDRD
jgi:hypothetical protein